MTALDKLNSKTQRLAGLLCLLHSVFVNQDEIRSKAKQYGITIPGEIKLNEMGLDFQVAMGTDSQGQAWVLRLPRLENMFAQIDYEAHCLRVIQDHLRVRIPDWKTVRPDFVAYPLLEGSPTLTFDAKTYEVSWNIDPKSHLFVAELAQLMSQLHAIQAHEFTGVRVKAVDPSDFRSNIASDIDTVRRELGMSEKLEAQFREWVDMDGVWPDFSVLTHGDLYAGHILTLKTGHITGVIDWSEVSFNDPSIDFAGHFTVFGEESTRDLIDMYSKAGGRVWPRMFEQIKRRSGAAVLKYAIFALKNGSAEHIEAVKLQLNP